jgi:dolichol-phosphate mannosyltransferase
MNSVENGSPNVSKPMLERQVDSLRQLKRRYEVKLGKMSRPVQFVLVGSSGAVLDLSTYALLTLVIPWHAARGLAIWAAMTWNFWLNRRITFSDARSSSVLRQYGLFCLSCSLGAVVNYVSSIALSSVFTFFNNHKLAAALCGILAGTVFNYLFSFHVVFRPKQNIAPPVATLSPPVQNGAVVQAGQLVSDG